ncbi:MAG: hypothetical protein LLG04_03725 [Parachlamydia sp.]|nr:hypothetical protein [Parachlamydia sp.]
MRIFEALSLTEEESKKALNMLDSHYLSYLKRYFDVDKAGILAADGTLPAAEKGSSGEWQLLKHNATLRKHRKFS